eukprot:6206890-Pyramimonas_sp.AAC.1
MRAQTRAANAEGSDGKSSLSKQARNLPPRRGFLPLGAELSPSPKTLSARAPPVANAILNLPARARLARGPIGGDGKPMEACSR